MAITKRPVGEARAVATAGNIVGQAQRAEEERARAERTRAAQVAREWELQKMVLNSQQEFAHEQRLRQAELDGEARAKEWEVEKMEIKSRIDFEKEEKQRAKTMELFSAKAQKARESIEKGIVDKKDYQWQLDYYDYVADTGDERVSPAAFKPTVNRYDTLSAEEEAKRQRIAAGLEPRAATVRPTTLSPEQQATADRIRAGIEARPSRFPLADYRNNLLAITGDAYKDADLTELESTVREMGVDPDTLNPAKTQAPGVPTGQGKQLDKTTAEQILKEAGGDRAKARELARQRGYQF